MINSGDIGASFRWEAEKFEPDFTISPVDGYISPGMQVCSTYQTISLWYTYGTNELFNLPLGLDLPEQAMGWLPGISSKKKNLYVLR